MADQSDVEVALVNVVSAALYPTGINDPSVPGPDCRIYRGWPNSAALDADLGAGKINVTVFPAGSPTLTATRYAEHWMGQPPKPTLTTTVEGTSVTFGGTADVGQIAGILVDGRSYAYRTRSGDTPPLVAAISRRWHAKIDRPPVPQHADDSRGWRSPGTRGRGRRGPTGSTSPGARISHHLLVSHACHPRCSCGCDRPGLEPPALPRAAGWHQRQNGLHRHNRIRSIAECQVVSA